VTTSLARVVVLVGDQDAALGFYRDALGFETLHDAEAGDHPLLVVHVADLDAARERLAAHGVEVFRDRTDADSRSLQFRDVAGNVIVAAELAPSVA
jgi:predicted enzyme related to lactoylglutathione lyase